MPKLLTLCLCTLLFLIPLQSALAKKVSHTDNLPPTTILPAVHFKSIQDKVSSILEDEELPTVLTDTISADQARENDKQIEQEVVAELKRSQNKGSKNNVQNENDANSDGSGDLQNTGDANLDEIITAMDLEGDSEYESSGDSLIGMTSQETTEAVSTEDKIDSEFEQLQEDIANQILGTGEKFTKSLEDIVDNFGDSNGKSETKLKSGSSNEILLETGKNEETHYFSKGPIFILGLGIVIVIVLAVRMMTEERNETTKRQAQAQAQEHTEERESLTLNMS